MFLSEVTFGELMKGLHKLPEGPRRSRLKRFIADEGVDRFEGRWLPADWSVWLAWGERMGAGERRGRPVGAMDALQASIAAVNGLTVVTKNVRDFTTLEVEVVNPWTE
jgi:toxin FitB